MSRKFRISAKKFRGAVVFLSILIVAGCIALPIFLTFVYSFESPLSMNEYMEQMGQLNAETWIRFKWTPDFFTMRQYFTLLFEQVSYLRFYFNTVFYAATIVVFQLMIGSGAAFTLSFYKARFRSLIFFSYVIVMVLPFQVTMVPNFMVIRWLNLYDTPWAVILPGIFAPMATFLMRQYMVTLPSSMVEAARIDGAGVGSIYARIVLPASKPAICAAMMLCGAEAWNMIEQPMILLSSANLYPLSLALFGNLDMNNADFAAAALYMLPIFLLFLYFRDDLLSGIQLIDLK